MSSYVSKSPDSTDHVHDVPSDIVNIHFKITTDLFTQMSYKLPLDDQGSTISKNFKIACSYYKVFLFSSFVLGTQVY